MKEFNIYSLKNFFSFSGPYFICKPAFQGSGFRLHSLARTATPPFQSGVGFRLQKRIKKIAKLCLFSFLALSPAFLFAKVQFADLDINSNSELLFTAEQDGGGTLPYKSIFLSRLDESQTSPKLLTCFPEHMELLDGGKKLQVRNRYGTAVYNLLTQSLDWISKSSGFPVEYSSTGVQEASPDGKWICSVRQSGKAQGTLLLESAADRKSLVLNPNAQICYDRINVKWSPDSSALLYEKNGSVYFAKPETLFSGISFPDSFYKIGAGSINSVEWTPRGDIIYVSGDIVYLIQSTELFTRVLYAKLLGSGRITGRLPLRFNPETDYFTACDDGLQLAVCCGEKTVYWYQADLTKEESSGKNPKPQGCRFYKNVGCYPLTQTDGIVIRSQIFWTAEPSKKPVLWLDLIEYGSCSKKSLAYVLGSKPLLAVQTSFNTRPRLSPDGKHIAFSSQDTLFVYSTVNWKQEAALRGEQIVSFVWSGSSAIFAGGESTVRLWDIANNEYIFLFLSSVEKANWDAGRIYAFTKKDSSGKENVFAFDSSTKNWNHVKNGIKSELRPSLTNGYYRVYLGKGRNDFYGNAIFVRSLSLPVKTYPLFADSQKTEAQKKRVALIFDAQDNAEGLAQVLSVLKEFNVSATFFVNGEFIRRYPQETKQIALSGFECASSFYCNANLLDDSFTIDADFIKRGLGRNEDEFYAATGKELSPLWHAPFYSADEKMRRAGNAAGYIYVDAYRELSDRITIEESMLTGKPYKNACQIIDELSPLLSDGMVIPVNIGALPSGSRGDYLYQKLGILISAILNRGYSIVDVGTLTLSEMEEDAGM